MFSAAFRVMVAISKYYHQLAAARAAVDYPSHMRRGFMMLTGAKYEK